LLNKGDVIDPLPSVQIYAKMPGNSSIQSVKKKGRLVVIFFFFFFCCCKLIYYLFIFFFFLTLLYIFKSIKGVLMSEQALTLKGVRMGDDCSLSDYGIGRGTVVDVITPLSTIPNFAETEEGRKIPLEVSREDTIKNVKKQLEEEESI
jgi:hypothetical protein